MITHDFHGTPIYFSQIPHYYEMGWLTEEDAREYEKTLAKREFEGLTNIVLLARKDQVNTSAIQAEGLRLLSKYAERPIIADILGSSGNNTPDQSYLFRQPTIAAPRNLLSGQAGDDEDSSSSMIFPNRYRL